MSITLTGQTIKERVDAIWTLPAAERHEALQQAFGHSAIRWSAEQNDKLSAEDVSGRLLKLLEHCSTPRPRTPDIS